MQLHYTSNSKYETFRDINWFSFQVEFFAQLNREANGNDSTPTDGDDFYKKLEHDLNYQDPARSRVAINILSVACGKTHSLALTDCGLYTWGSSKYGQLGLGRDKLVNSC